MSLLEAALLLAAAAVTPQTTGTDVSLDPEIACWYHDGFPELEARLEPSSDVRHARLYFRCSSYAEYYFVNLEPLPTGTFRGVGPMAEPSCPAVHYYVEALSRNFATARTPEEVANVTSVDDCRRRYPAPAVFTGRPRLVVGSTVAGAERMPEGFQTLGIDGYLTPAGELIGSGMAPAGYVAIGASAIGAGAAAVAFAGNGESDAPETILEPEADPANVSAGTSPGQAPPPPPTPPSPSPAPPQGTVEACFETEPPDATILAGDSIRLDARCSSGDALSFRWDLGDGRPSREGPFITPVYRNPGRFTVTLTVESVPAGLVATTDSIARVVTVEEPPVTLVACFDAASINPGANCDVVFDAGCSVGDIVAYDWVLDESNVMGAGPYPETGPLVTHDWTGYPGCVTTPPWPNIRVKLTVTDRSGLQATTTGLVGVPYFAPSSRATYDATRAQRDGTLTSHLDVAPADGSVAGRIVVNQRSTFVVRNDAPLTFQALSRTGANAVEATLPSRPSEPGLWRFDLSGIAGLRSGSLRASAGDVVASGAHEIVFRVGVSENEVVRFVYHVDPSR